LVLYEISMAMTVDPPKSLSRDLAMDALAFYKSSISSQIHNQMKGVTLTLKLEEKIAAIIRDALQIPPLELRHLEGNPKLVSETTFEPDEKMIQYALWDPPAPPLELRHSEGNPKLVSETTFEPDEKMIQYALWDPPAPPLELRHSEGNPKLVSETTFELDEKMIQYALWDPPAPPLELRHSEGNPKLVSETTFKLWEKIATVIQDALRVQRPSQAKSLKTSKHQRKVIRLRK
jgi:hypothetical protein